MFELRIHVYFRRGLKHLTKLLTKHEMKSFYLVPGIDQGYFNTIAQYIRPNLPEILEMAKAPKLLNETIETFECEQIAVNHG